MHSHGHSHSHSHGHLDKDSDHVHLRAASIRRLASLAVPDIGYLTIAIFALFIFSRSKLDYARCIR
jgi:hypothetical protein